MAELLLSRYTFLFIMITRRGLELRQQVGQLLVMGFEGQELAVRLRSTLATLCPGGIILFKRNIAEARQTHSLLQDCQKTLPIPMLLSVDMEGGTVDRFRDVIGRMPAPADVSATGLKELFWKHGMLIGSQLHALGFNTDFAPCLDLAFDAAKRVLTTRVVSVNPMEVVTYARRFLRGLRDGSVLGCGKHFPGLGEANLDSHHDLPHIDKPLKKMWVEDLVPYRELRRELPFVMVAHLSNGAVTGDPVPASVSRKWITGILRKKIGYRGLVVSDDLDMEGVLSSRSIEQAAVETLQAGADLFLVCQKEENVWRAFEGVLQRAESDRRFASLIAGKAERVLGFKKKSKLLNLPMSAPPTEKTIAKLRTNLEHFAEEVALQASSHAEVGA